MTVKEKRILAVGAHPDDIEFMCSGTLLLLGEAGFELHVATMTIGDLGTKDRLRPEIAEIRQAEAGSAAERLGAQYHYVGFHDFCIFDGDESNRRVAALLRDVDPWLVITHPPMDYVSDHELTSRLVRNACFSAIIPNYHTINYSLAKPLSKVPYLYYAQPAEGTDIYGQPVVPDFYVDIADQISRKEELLACHDSQRSWLRSYHGMDEYLETMRRWSGEMGKQATRYSDKDIEFAEGFRQHRGHAYPSDNILAELLEDRVVKVERE